jgi:hypothetical protein
MFLKLITAGLLLAHGIGHVMAPQAAFVPPGAFPRTSHMIATGMTITSSGGKALSLLWLLPMVGFVLGTYGLWTDQEWWRPVLAASAVVSIFAVLPWAGVMPTFSYLGALLVDVLVLLAVLTPWGDQFVRAFR